MSTTHLTPDTNRLQGKYTVTVIWNHGDFWAPYGIHHFVFEDKSKAEVFFRDADWSLRRRQEYNWLYQGHTFWTARILVLFVDPTGCTIRGWQGFTLNDDEVVRECHARVVDVEACLADRAKLRESRDVPVFVNWKE